MSRAGVAKSVFCACFAFLTAAVLFPRLAPAVTLTVAEKRYLAESGPITMCVDPDWAPFERINDAGRHEGIAADLLRLVAERTGARIDLVKTRDWDESVAFSKSGRCDILSFLNESPTRDAWLIFTDPIFTDPNVFITREEHKFIADPASLGAESITLPKGTSVEERVRRDYPNLRVMLTETEGEAITLVSEKRADMTMRSLIVAAHTIKTEGLFNLKIAGQSPNYANHLRIGVLKEKPVLRTILNRGVQDINESERSGIVNRYVSIKMETAPDDSLSKAVKIGGLVAAMLAAGWAWRMRVVNRRLARLSETDALTGLNNRKKIEESLQREFSRSKRYNRPFSLLVLDIDHFKMINDEFGHVTGDKVIIGIARIAGAAIRQADFIGRWGGEEFLLLCPETAMADALVVAERVRAGVAAATFPTGRSHSVSIGVASLRGDDEEETLLKRADAAMYLAKSAGRNQVRCL